MKTRINVKFEFGLMDGKNNLIYSYEKVRIPNVMLIFCFLALTWFTSATRMHVVKPSLWETF